jgi:hypothetical protein
MRERIVLPAGALLAALFLACSAQAQSVDNKSPATNPVDASYATQQQKQQITQPLNNQPVWS